MELNDWIVAYANAWETANEDLIVSLFTPEATYRSSPYHEPHRGHAEIRCYWRRAAGRQSETRVRMGKPYAEGTRVAVEWWTTMIEGQAQVTLPGCLLLRFASDGRCADLHEYWNLTEGHHEPFGGWGE